MLSWALYALMLQRLVRVKISYYFWGDARTIKTGTGRLWLLNLQVWGIWFSLALHLCHQSLTPEGQEYLVRMCLGR
jgi:drug/metabolite transporter (DMT)-like permease